jgi:hypothetical protein
MTSLVDQRELRSLLDPMPSGDRFFLRRQPEIGFSDDPYLLLLAVTGGRTHDVRAIERGNYAWALRKARELRIPDCNISHDYAETDGSDDGYEGWHLNARIVRGA